MGIPFRTDQFLEVFARYNVAVWPAQWVLYSLALLATALVLARTRQSNQLISCILGAFWLWSGVIYHLGFFSAINPAAYLFAALFIAESLLLIWDGVRPERLSYERDSGAHFLAGAFLITSALFIYPVTSFLAGHRYPATPTFGLPCPITIFTVGLLMWSKPPTPVRVVVIPLVWCALGLTSAVTLGMYEDSLLSLGILAGGWLLLAQHKRIPGRSSQAVRAHL